MPKRCSCSSATAGSPVPIRKAALSSLPPSRAFSSRPPICQGTRKTSSRCYEGPSTSPRTSPSGCSDRYSFDWRPAIRRALFPRAVLSARFVASAAGCWVNVRIDNSSTRSRAWRCWARRWFFSDTPPGLKIARSPYYLMARNSTTCILLR